MTSDPDTLIAERYALGELIGEGGMGEVYAATHVVTGKRLAIKLLPPDKSLDEQAVARFRREARAAGVLETDHIVEVFDSGVDRDRAYIAMERLEGETLRETEERLGRLEPRLAVRIVAQACLGVAAAHEKGIVHRDLKPSNLFIVHNDASGDATAPRLVKVLDFGIAKLDPGLRELSDGEDLTRTGTVLGSPHYISPEQIRAQNRVGPKSDIFALGVVLYEALGGRRPHEAATTLMQIMFRTYMERAPAIRELAPWVDGPLAGIVHRALSLDPDERYADAGELGEALREWLDDGIGLEVEMFVPLPKELAEQAPELERFNPSDEAGTETDSDVEGMRERWAADVTELAPSLPDAVPSDPAPVPSARGKITAGLALVAALGLAIWVWPVPVSQLQSGLSPPLVGVAAEVETRPPPSSEPSDVASASSSTVATPPATSAGAATGPAASTSPPPSAKPVSPQPRTISKNTDEFDG
jgi:eukaryotic-like serine/threonine-protein kinase